MTQGQKIVGVAHHNGDVPHRFDGVAVGIGVVAHPGRLFHPVQGHVEHQRAGDPTLRATPLGGGEPALLDHTRRQPLRDQPPGGERADLP